MRAIGERYALDGRDGMDLPEAPEWMKCGKGMRGRPSSVGSEVDFGEGRSRAKENV